MDDDFELPARQIPVRFGPSWQTGEGFLPVTEWETTIPWSKYPNAPGPDAQPMDRLDRYASCLVPPVAGYLGSGDYLVTGGDVQVQMRKWDHRRTSIWNAQETCFVLRPEAKARYIYEVHLQVCVYIFI